MKYSLLAIAVFAGPGTLARAADPLDKTLHKAIDAGIAARAGDRPLAKAAGDAEFLRRIYLDLAGRIPNVEEARQFLGENSAENSVGKSADDADNSTDKRDRLIDRLLDGPDYPRRMQELFHAMLMERRGDNEDWAKFLQTACEQNMPWDQVAQAIIRPDADDENTRCAAYFFTARLVSEGAMAPVDVPGLTRDIGRLLAGVDLSCAQCHDHVSINDYKQVDFQGLHMVFENVQTRRDVKFPAVAEKLMTQKKEFMSVFTQEPRTTPPRVPGAGDVEIATFAKGEEYEVPPDRKTRSPGVPKFSPLKELAGRLASRENDLFCRNIVNRLWHMMMGRGLIEPLDLQHGDNPPTHPELLDLLASEFAAHDFDMKWLLREIARSDSYQRTSVVSAEPAPDWQTYAVANEKRLSAEQLFWSVLTATSELDRVRKSPDAALATVVAESEPLVDLQKLFVKTFANPPKEPEVSFEPSVKGALFLMHDDKVLALLKPRKGSLVDRLAGISDADKLADELFLSILSRHPADEDRQDVREFMADRSADDRAEAIGQLAWALLSSTEFCVNH